MYTLPPLSHYFPIALAFRLSSSIDYFLHIESAQSIFLSIYRSDPPFDSRLITMLRKKQNEEKSHMNRTWLLLILAISGSALSMMAIGILLVHYHDQPIFDWNGLTLNAIVAVFSAISKAMLAYALSECLGQAKWIWFSSHQRPLSDINLIDSGSRGPLGSFQILTRPVARSFISMGAIIVILSAIMDPFVQLTIGKKDGVRFENSTFVQIAYAKRYNKELTETPSIPEADLGMQSAVLDGLTQPDSWISQQTRHSCPSGNCTWDTFTSLAICSDCHDITNRIEKIEETDHYFGRFHSYKAYRLPNHLFGGGVKSPMTAYGTTNRTETVSFAFFDTLIWSMTIMNYTMKEERAISGNYSAMECALWYCVNSYKPAVKNGIFTETIQPAPSKRKLDSWQPFQSSKNDSEIFVSSRRLAYATPADLSTNHTEDYFTFVRRRTDLQLGEGFNVSEGAFYSTGSLLRDTLTIPLMQFDKGVIANALVERAHDGAPYEYVPPAMQNLYNSQDLAAKFATLAKSMTNNIRQNDDNHSVIHGSEEKYVALIRIRGWFLILPIILIIGGAIFLAVVLHYTHRFKMEFWGTNALPIVALGEKIEPIFDNNDMRVKMMEKKAKQQLVQISVTPHRDFDQVNTLSPSVTQIPSTDVASITSPTHTSMIQSQSADVEGIASLSRISVIQSPPADMENSVSLLRNSAIQSPSSDVMSVASPRRTSIIQSRSADAEDISLLSRTSVIQNSPADMESIESPRHTTVIQSPSADVENIVSPLRNSEIQSPSSDAVSTVSNRA